MIYIYIYIYLYNNTPIKIHACFCSPNWRKLGYTKSYLHQSFFNIFMQTVTSFTIAHYFELLTCTLNTLLLIFCWILYTILSYDYITKVDMNHIMIHFPNHLKKILQNLQKEQQHEQVICITYSADITMSIQRVYRLDYRLTWWNVDLNTQVETER